MEERALFLKTVSAGFEFALTAAGKIDGRICIKPFGKVLDYAPGAFLVKEAGGIVKNIGSPNYDYKNFDLVAVNKFVYRDLVNDKLIY